MKNLKKVFFIIGLFSFVPLIYLIYIANSNYVWNKTEGYIFALCLLIGTINLVLFYYQKKRNNKNP
jgi:hypothetical protein